MKNYVLSIPSVFFEKHEKQIRELYPYWIYNFKNLSYTAYEIPEYFYLKLINLQKKGE